MRSRAPLCETTSKSKDDATTGRVCGNGAPQVANILAGVRVEMEIAVLLAAANRCPPVLKQHSPHTLMANSFTSLLHGMVGP